jgi:transglutaminase-like putative cysteine protease
MSAFRKRDTRIPRRPLLWLAAALLFTLPPMFGTLAIWVPLLFLIALTAKFWMEPKGYRLRSVIWKLVLAGVTLAAIFFSYGSVKGIEPGVSLIVVLMSLKILEAHTAREFQVMVMIGWVLCLCGFFLSQDLAIAVCLLIAFTLLLVALIQFHRGSSPGAFWPPVRTAGKLLAQALPLVVLLFLLFPRVTTGFRFQLMQPGSATAGFSDRLSPGSIASLANSSDVAFRAEFPDGRIPRPAAMYWRGVVMWQGEGLEWRASDAPASIPRSARRSPDSEAIRQRITIEPHGARWMFALDWPSEPPSGATLAPGNYLWSGQPIRKPRRYEVRSLPEIREKELRPRERKILLQVPTWISPAVRELAKSWTAASASPRTVVNAALQFFGTHGFRYSLSPGEYKRNDLDEFLFRRRLGFCEHYAASFATLMRLAGIPARIVVGYLGGEYNEFGRFFLVRQTDTHAWCEVWLPESGWVRIDPTSVVAPERVNLGFDSFLQRRAALGQPDNIRSALAKNLRGMLIFTKARLAWESLNYAWDTRVLSFDAEAQRSFVAEIGISDSGPFSLLVPTLLIAAVLLAIYAGWMRLRTRPGGDRVKALYERFCRKAARLGAQRDPWEGPSDFSARAARLLPEESEHIRRISNTYIVLRYSPEAAPPVLGRFAKEVNAFASAARRLLR